VDNSFDYIQIASVTLARSYIYIKSFLIKFSLMMMILLFVCLTGSDRKKFW